MIWNAVNYAVSLSFRPMVRNRGDAVADLRTKGRLGYAIADGSFKYALLDEMAEPQAMEKGKHKTKAGSKFRKSRALRKPSRGPAVESAPAQSG